MYNVTVIKQWYEKLSSTDMNLCRFNHLTQLLPSHVVTDVMCIKPNPSSDFRAYLNSLSSKGKLSFKPYIKSAEAPMLCLSYKRYIAWTPTGFKLYCLEKDGVRVLGSSTVPMVKVQDSVDNELLVDLCKWSDLISAGLKDNRFCNLLVDNEQVLKDFLLLTCGLNNPHFNVSDLLKLCLSNESIATTELAYRVPHNNNSDYATIEVTESIIKVVTPNTARMLELPVAVYNRYVLLSLITLVCNLLNVQIQWNCCRALSDTDYMIACNYEHVKVFDPHKFVKGEI